MIGTQITNQITCKVVNKRLKQRFSSQQQLKQLKVLKEKALKAVGWKALKAVGWKGQAEGRKQAGWKGFNVGN